MVGLGNVDNTTDLLKPISTATQSALDLKANLASPTFTGTVTASGTITAGVVIYPNSRWYKRSSFCQQQVVEL